MKYFDAGPTASYNGVFTFFLSNRNYGKTWGFQRRQAQRALKHGKKCIWVRRFKKEAKEAAAKLYKSSDLLAFCGLTPYNPDTKEGNFKKDGYTFYVKRRGKWVDFMKVACLSDANSLRSADDVACDTIVFDEFTTTPEKYSLFRGNEVEAFIDMFISAKRMHKVRCFFLGNKESGSNPYFRYFGVPDMSQTFEGVRRFRNGAVVVQWINNETRTVSEYEKRVFDLLKGTAYGDYLYQSTFKRSAFIKPTKTPPGASLYVQIEWAGAALTFSIAGGFFYVRRGVSEALPVYVDAIQKRHVKEQQLLRRQKCFFTTLINAVADGRVFYESAGTFEACLPFYKWLGI